MDRENGDAADDVDRGSAERARSLDAPSAGVARARADDLPDGVRERVARLRRLSRALDSAVTIPGTNVRIGLDPILGLLPVAGDAVSAALSLYPVAEAYRFGASRRTLAKMLGLVGIDAAIGSIPVIGDVFDAFWKANEWNARTLERLVQGE